MEKITLREYFKKYGPNKFKSIMTTLGPDYEELKNRWTKFVDRNGNEIEISIPSFEEMMYLLDKVNKEIKNKDVPKKVRNKFYLFKHHILKDMVKHFHTITTIGDCDKYYALHYGPYVFHQMKYLFRNPLECTHTEKYIPAHCLEDNDDDKYPFNMLDYKLCLVGITTYSFNKNSKYL